MTDEPQTAVGEAEKVEEILRACRLLINSTPDLLSLLYDYDLLPEQIISVRGARSVAAVCDAYDAALSSVSERERGLVEALEQIARDLHGCPAVHRKTEMQRIARSALQSMKGE